MMNCPLCGRDEYVEQVGCPYCGFVIPPDIQDDVRVVVSDDDRIFFEKLGLSGEHTLPDPDSLSVDAINQMMMQMGIDPINLGNTREDEDPHVKPVNAIDLGISVPDTVTGTADDIAVVPELDMSTMNPEDFALAIRQMMSVDTETLLESDVESTPAQEREPEVELTAMPHVPEKRVKKPARKLSKQTKDRLFYWMMPLLMLALVAVGVWMVLSLQNANANPPPEAAQTDRYTPWTPPPETAAPLQIIHNP